MGNFNLFGGKFLEAFYGMWKGAMCKFYFHQFFSKMAHVPISTNSCYPQLVDCHTVNK